MESATAIFSVFAGFIIALLTCVIIISVLLVKSWQKHNQSESNIQQLKNYLDYEISRSKNNLSKVEAAVKPIALSCIQHEKLLRKTENDNKLARLHQAKVEKVDETKLPKMGIRSLDHRYQHGLKPVSTNPSSGQSVESTKRSNSTKTSNSNKSRNNIPQQKIKIIPVEICKSPESSISTTSTNLSTFNQASQHTDTDTRNWMNKIPSGINGSKAGTRPSEVETKSYVSTKSTLNQDSKSPYSPAISEPVIETVSLPVETALEMTSVKSNQSSNSDTTQASGLSSTVKSCKTIIERRPIWDCGPTLVGINSATELGQKEIHQGRTSKSESDEKIHQMKLIDSANFLKQFNWRKTDSTNEKTEITNKFTPNPNRPLDRQATGGHLFTGQHCETISDLETAFEEPRDTSFVARVLERGKKEGFN